MKTVIVCYSLTGRTRKVCSALAGRLGAELVEIEAPLVGTGFWSMLRWGFAALRGRHTAVQAPPVRFDPRDTVILGAQIWAGRLSVPMRAWIHSAPTLPARVALVLTSGDKRFPQRGFDQFALLTDRAPVARLHVSQEDCDTGHIAPQLETFCAALQAGNDVTEATGDEVGEARDEGSATGA